MSPVFQAYKVNGQSLSYNEFTKEVLRTIKRADKASPSYIRKTLRMRPSDKNRLQRVLEELAFHGFLRQPCAGVYQVHPMLLIEGA
jgi:hypothetical protein